MTIAPPTIHEAMAQVFAKVEPVAKALKNSDAGYAARSIDDVMNALHGPMADAGVFPTPLVEQAHYDVVEVGRNRTPMRQATLRVRFRFHGPAGDYVDAITYGEALDSGDKATNKAISAALKYALLQTFVIPLVGDDADAHSPERSAPEPRATEAQKKQIAAELHKLDEHARKIANDSIKATYGPASRLPARDVGDVLELVRSIAETTAPEEVAAAADAPGAGEVPPAGSNRSTTEPNVEGGAAAAHICPTCALEGGAHEDGCPEAGA